MSPRFFYRSPLNHYTLLANSSLQKRNSASDSNRLFIHGLRRNEKQRPTNARKSLIFIVDQPGLEPGTSRL